MADTITATADPKLTDHTTQPKGVLQKNLKMFLYLGAVVLLILATVISSRKKAPTDAEKAKANGPQPYVQDNTATNVDALQRQLGADKLKAQQDAQVAAASSNPAAGGTGAQQAAASGFGPMGVRSPRQAPTPLVDSQTAPRRTGSPSLPPHSRLDSSLPLPRRRGRTQPGFRRTSPMPVRRSRQLLRIRLANLRRRITPMQPSCNPVSLRG
jgi:hypothetical protein